MIFRVQEGSETKTLQRQSMKTSCVSCLMFSCLFSAVCLSVCVVSVLCIRPVRAVPLCPAPQTSA